MPAAYFECRLDALSASGTGGREYMTLMMRDLENQEMGAEKAHREKIEELLRDGKTPQAIVDFCKYPMKLVMEVQKNMLVAK